MTGFVPHVLVIGVSATRIAAWLILVGILALCVLWGYAALMMVLEGKEKDERRR